MYFMRNYFDHYNDSFYNSQSSTYLSNKRAQRMKERHRIKTMRISAISRILQVKYIQKKNSI